MKAHGPCQFADKRPKRSKLHVNNATSSEIVWLRLQTESRAASLAIHPPIRMNNLGAVAGSPLTAHMHEPVTATQPIRISQARSMGSAIGMIP